VELIHMPMVVSCSCGKRFEAKDSLAGQRVRCPACGGILDIPLSQPARQGASAAAINDPWRIVPAGQPQHSAPSYGTPAASGFGQQAAAQQKSPGMSTGLLVGIVVAGIGAMMLLGIAIMFSAYWSSTRDTQSPEAISSASSAASSAASSTAPSARPSAQTGSSQTTLTPAASSSSATPAQTSTAENAAPANNAKPPAGWEIFTYKSACFQC
jgi:hypothetical protein